MNKEENILKEAKDILSEGKKSLVVEKDIIYDNNSNQFSIKIPREIALASDLRKGDKVRIISRPTEEDLKEVRLSGIIIYGKKKESTK